MAFVNMTNRNFALESVVAGLAQSLGCGALTRAYVSEVVPGAASSHWAVVAPDFGTLDSLRTEPGLRNLVIDPGFRTWTDDYSNLLAVLR